MNPIKDAFSKVKEDISNLYLQIRYLTEEFHELKRTLTKTDRQSDTQTSKEFIQTQNQTPPHFHSTQNQTHQTDRQILENNPPLKGSKLSNSNSSIRNKGVQTDRQTNQQTDINTQKFAQSNLSLNPKSDSLSKIDKVSEVLSSLDSLKKDLRTKFKRLTEQEMLIFSSIYQLEEEGFTVDYSLISKKTNLSQSSIRDYVQKLLKKGVPVDKQKENNKRVVLSIPQDFKRMASIETILALRDI